MNRRHRIALAAVVSATIAAVPGTAHADAAAPTDWRSEIAAITPETDAVSPSIEGGDAFVRIDVRPGHEVIVLGYSDEPYLWIDGDGVVHENRRSPAVYINRTLGGTTEVPADADPAAPPEWSVVGDGGSWSWHDHRAHYMGGAPPAGMRAGESLPETFVPIIVDDVPTEITVVTTLVGSPSPWPAIVGGLIGVVLALATVVSKRRIPAALAILPIALTASVLGIVQYLSLPQETGPRLIWWIPAVVASLCGFALLLVRRTSPFARSALMLVAASQLVVWGWARRTGIARAVLPTPAPYWLDRATTAAALAGGVALFGVAVYELIRFVDQASSARSMASSSAS